MLLPLLGCSPRGEVLVAVGAVSKPKVMLVASGGATRTAGRGMEELVANGLLAEWRREEPLTLLREPTSMFSKRSAAALSVKLEREGRLPRTGNADARSVDFRLVPR